jgi:hypothetical protein
LRLETSALAEAPLLEFEIAAELIEAGLKSLRPDMPRSILRQASRMAEPGVCAVFVQKEARRQVDCAALLFWRMW